MNILLLAVNSNTFFYSQVVTPFGLASLGSYVEKDGHAIRGIEMNTPPDRIPERYLKVDPEIMGRIVEFSPDLVCMSTYSSNIHNVLFWAGEIKKRLPSTWIALGGNHASYIAQEILDTCPAVDFVVRHEGEIAFKRLCEELREKTCTFENVPNLSFRKDHDVLETPIAELIRDLDTLPPLNHSFFGDQEKSDLTHADIVTARGCPFHCTFCNCNHFWEKRYRRFSVGRVIEEIRDLKAKYPRLSTIRFRDEAISIDRRHCLALCAALNEADFGLKYQAHSRLDGLDEEVIVSLQRAGFNRLYVGLESGSKAVLQRMNKGIDIDKAHDIVRLLRKYKLPVRFSLMSATRGETMDETLETINLVRELDLDFDEFYFGFGLQIYPGTKDSEAFLREHPGYQWLRPRRLCNGYSQSVDPLGNPVVVSYSSGEYTSNDLHAQLSKALEKKLAVSGFANYQALVAEQGRLRYPIDRARENPQLVEQVSSLLAVLDRTGIPWAVYRRGVFSQVFPEDLFAGQNWRLCMGVFSAQDEKDAGASIIRKKLRGVRRLLMVMPDNVSQDRGMLHKIATQWKYRGDLLLFERFVSLQETDPSILHVAAEDILKEVTLRPDWRRIRLAVLYHATGLHDLRKALGSVVRRFGRLAGL